MKPIRFKQIYEQFLTSRRDIYGYKKLFFNTRNNDKTIEEVLESFTASGGRLLSGQYGWVLTHPDNDYVIKFFYSDDQYKQFLRYIKTHPSISFPRILDRVENRIPNYKRTIEDERVNIVVMEKLYELTKREKLRFYSLTQLFDSFISSKINYYTAKNRLDAINRMRIANRRTQKMRNEKKVLEGVINITTSNIKEYKKELVNKYRRMRITNANVRSIYKMVYELVLRRQYMPSGEKLKETAIELDLHTGNIMKRRVADNKVEYVITDPAVGNVGNQKQIRDRYKKEKILTKFVLSDVDKVISKLSDILKSLSEAGRESSKEFKRYHKLRNNSTFLLGGEDINQYKNRIHDVLREVNQVNSPKKPVNSN